MRARLSLGERAQLYIPWMELHRKSIRQSQIMSESFNGLFPPVAEESAPTHITRWKQNHSRLNPRTVNRRMALLKGMMSWAVREGHLNSNPLRGNVEMLKEDDGRVRFLTPEERGRLLSALEARDSEEKR